ncbi:MAG TPA: HEAT repeat domain-containing protein [Victivallales bacterium]|nr:HEAT repeat domain-containing protein [Victivallales bacterium]
MNRNWKIAIFAAAIVIVGLATIRFLPLPSNLSIAQVPSSKAKAPYFLGRNSVHDTNSVPNPASKNKELPGIAEEFMALDESGKVNYLANMEFLEASVIDVALDDVSEDVRLVAVNSLSAFAEDGKDVSAHLAKAFKDESENVRDSAFVVMESIPDRRTVLSLMDSALDSPYPDARISTVKSFINTDSSRDEVRNMIIKALSDTDEDVRFWALACADFMWDKDFTSEKEALKFIRK